MISVDWIIFLKFMMNDEEWDKIGFLGEPSYNIYMYRCLSNLRHVRSAPLYAIANKYYYCLCTHLH